jgi:hypothetical protein
MKWMIYNASDKFSYYKTLWNDINCDTTNNILLDFDFIEPMLKRYGNNNTVFAVLNDESSRGIMLLERQNRFFWQTFQPQNAPIGLVLLDTNEIEKSVDFLIRSLPGVSLGLGVTNQDPDFTSFNGIVKSEKIDILDYIKTPRIKITGDFKNYWETRDKDFVQNMARRERKIKEKGGEIALVEHRKPEEIPFAIQEYSRIECSGWKGKKGTAVAENNIQGVLYRDILERFTDRGEGIIYRLLLNGKAIASQIAIMRNNMIVFLKTTYDENYKDLSPGLMMRKEIIKRLFYEKKIETVELYGHVHDWHMKWTDQIRTMYHVNFYRNSIVKNGHNTYRNKISPLLHRS